MNNKKKTKKKFTLKKIKRIFINLLKEIGGFFKSLYNKFIRLSFQVRAIIGVWTVICILLVALVFAGSSNSKFLGSYSELESKMNEATVNYFKTYKLYPVYSNKEKVDIQVMLEFSTLYKADIFDDTCEGYSLGYYDEEIDDYVVDSYLNCKKYTTKGYSDNK